MRLKRIRLAGFKSFVDPTDVELPSALVGVAGPNGSGKSNIVDGVRWVMGESSARHLRGEAMADVIFNGSTGRQPLGSATVEMVFDNSEGRLGGEYANWSEIAIRRTVDREGISSYYLNGTRCRRRDITDVFLGTGLGPRSYAIIEQGTISRLIESKPEELREFLEEAAGISRYRERRRETENRIHHTRENLARVDDVLEEVGKQLSHLRRQARAAERYRDLKAEERQRRSELLALRIAALDVELTTREDEVRGQSVGLEAELARERATERDLVVARAGHDAAVDEAGTVQQRYFELQTEIARLEEGIAAARREHALHQDRAGALEARLRANAERREAQEKQAAALRRELARREPELGAAEDSARAAQASSADAEAAAEGLRGEDAAGREAFAETRRRIEVLEARLAGCADREEHLQRRGERIADERSRRQELDEDRSAEGARVTLEALKQRANVAQDEVADAARQVAQWRQRFDAAGETFANLGRDAAGVEGRLESLEQLVRARRGGEAAEEWLRAHDLERARRLVSSLDIAPGWEWALEVALGARLAAVEIDALDVDSLTDLARLAGGDLSFVESGAGTAAAGTLAARIAAPSPALLELLAGVREASSAAEAFAERDRLAPGESFLTRDGTWIGRHWLRVARPGEGESGAIGLERERLQLLGRRDALVGELAAAEESRMDAERRLQTALGAEAAAREASREAQEALAAGRAAEAELAGRERASRERLAALGAEATEVENALGDSEQEHRSLDTAMREARDALARIEAARRGEEPMLAEALTLARAKRMELEAAERAREGLHLQVELARAQSTSAEEAAERLRGESETLAAERAALLGRISETSEPGGELRKDLEERLEARHGIDAELASKRDRAAGIEMRVQELERERRAVAARVGELRETLERARLASQELRTRREGLAEQRAELGSELAAVLDAIEPGAEPGEWERRIEDLAKRIQRLGAINLAAIDECAAQSEREEYLQRQRADLNEALATLEDAMRRIDRETRARFRETFDRVNARFNELFPRLFGGGSAALVLTGEELLDAGVVVTARPPGKKNTGIQLLSGGEKALVAVALVFAIFELNPAPFCLLDEVDAPMDDSNVERFCALVREMSQRTQFVLITHNRRSMALCHQLIGVTMQEPGVSRLVGVDIDEAERLAVG
ncbi:MAG TPA: chromosome segregation protein SMC [Gammaproteobacteria bacterium]|nr:chromosome segregation protein SMC [Gammaproteobacteria bacterium]